MPISGAAAPYTIQFTDISNGKGTAWFWEFGDGDTDTTQNPTHTYDLPGTYTVTLWLTTANGVSQHSDTVTIGSSTSDCLSAWSLQETSGNRADSFGSVTLAEVNGPIGFGYGPDGTTGGQKAADLDAASEQVLVSSFDPSVLDDFSVSAWAYLDSSPTSAQFIVFIGSWWHPYATVGLYKEDVLIKALVADGTDYAQTTQVWPGSGWHFYVVNYDSAAQTVALSVDGGAFTISAALPGTLWRNPDSFVVLGASWTDVYANYWDGRICQVALWDRQLTVDEIAELYARKRIPPATVTTTAWTASEAAAGTPGYDPQVMLRLSNDGGKTWISEQWRSAGKKGEYLHRVRWNRLGAARRRVFEVSVTDPIPWKLTGAYLKMNSSKKDQ